MLVMTSYQYKKTYANVAHFIYLISEQDQYRHFALPFEELLEFQSCFSERSLIQLITISDNSQQNLI